MSAPNPALRREVIAIYKGAQHCSVPTRQHAYIYLAELLYLGRDYPQGYSWFRPRLHRAFMASAGLRDEEAIRKGIARAEFVKKELAYIP
ncbi:NADH-ubiquinone oxidoreductase complex 1/LYR family protein [Apiospora phragmitis]|uniref:NADH-ubiquinone oxidoreductase complex 1/LYR family protein n=1 Tax=Apiospora phragmitis TaxID=2905665 RepID=A0ABR1W6N4_9PEZI